MNAPTTIHHRPIAAPRVDGQRAPVGPRPELTLVRPQDCRIDPAYQRPITARGAQVIASMVREWDWDLFDPIKVVETAAGLWEVIDGQHRVAAALAHGAIDRLPAFVSRAADRAARARAFVTMNESRIAVTPAARFKAAVAAGDRDSTTIARLSLAAGATPMNGTRAGGWQVGDTTAISALYRLLRVAGEPGLERALRLCVAAGLAPITSDRLAALADLFGDVLKGEDAEASDALLILWLGADWDAVKDTADLAAIETGQTKARARAVELYRRARNTG